MRDQFHVVSSNKANPARVMAARDQDIVPDWAVPAASDGQTAAASVRP